MSASNSRANYGPSTIRVALINHRWWYDGRLSTYDPGSVGHTQINYPTQLHGSGRVVSYLNEFIKFSF